MRLTIGRRGCSSVSDGGHEAAKIVVIVDFALDYEMAAMRSPTLHWTSHLPTAERQYAHISTSIALNALRDASRSGVADRPEIFDVQNTHRGGASPLLTPSQVRQSRYEAACVWGSTRAAGRAMNPCQIVSHGGTFALRSDARIRRTSISSAVREIFRLRFGHLVTVPIQSPVHDQPSHSEREASGCL